MPLTITILQGGPRRQNQASLRRMFLLAGSLALDPDLDCGCWTSTVSLEFRSGSSDTAPAL